MRETPPEKSGDRGVGMAKPGPERGEHHLCFGGFLRD